MARDTHGAGGDATGAALSRWAQPAAMRTAASSAARRRRPAPTSAKLDVGGALVLAAVGVEEGHGEGSRVGRLHGEGEEGVLADGLRGLELRDLPAQVRHEHAVDEVVVLVDHLAVLALDDLHRVDDEHAHPDDVAGLDAGGDPDPDASDVGHGATPS